MSIKNKQPIKGGCGHTTKELEDNARGLFVVIGFLVVFVVLYAILAIFDR